MANQNFSVKWTLAEANTVKAALRDKMDRILQSSLRDMSDDEKEEAGRIETMLRRDF